MSKAKIKEWKSKLKGKETPRGGVSPRDTAEDNGAEGGGQVSINNDDQGGPEAASSAGPTATSAAAAHQHQGAGVPASPRTPSRSPRSGLRKKSYSTMDVHYQQHMSSTPRSSAASDTLRTGDESPSGLSGRKKRRSAKADTPATAELGVDSAASVPPATGGGGADGGDGAMEEGEKKTWRRWSALMANVPLPLSTVLTKSNSFLLSSPHSSSSSSSELPHSSRDAASSPPDAASPLTSSSSGNATLRRRGTTVMVVRSTEEENKVLREHIEQLQILLQEKHNEVQHFKTQLQAAKHEIAVLKGQLASGVPARLESMAPRGLGGGGPRSSKSTATGEGSLVEIGSHLYDDSLEDPNNAEAAAMGEGSQRAKGGAAGHHQGEEEDERTTTTSSDDVKDEEGGQQKRDADRRKERKKSMLMAMSRVDHSRFGMEVGGRSSLRAKSKERGDVLSMFKRDDASGDGEDSNRGPAHNNSQQSAAISESPSPLFAPADSGFVVEEEHECEITTTFFAAEGTNWYHEHFYGQPHRNFLGIETPLGTVLVSCKREGKAGEERNSQTSGDALQTSSGTYAATAFFRVLLFTQDGDQKVSMPAVSIDTAGGRDPIEKLLNTVNPLLFSAGIVKEITHPDMPEAVRRLEAKERPRKYKFGLMLVKEGQTQEEDIFSNTGGSVDWYEFLNFIGEKVRLKGWNRFAGGLDVKTDTTGEFSRFTEWQGSEIMWHVATMLPQGEGAQQIARKRHIGNDICILVFLDGKDASYSANTIRSHFIHNVITIRRIPSDSLEDDASQTRYHVSVASKEDVPVFGPPLPKPAVFRKDDSFKDFLLAKMINAELAAYRTVYFSKRLRLGRRALLDELVSDFFPLTDE